MTPVSLFLSALTQGLLYAPMAIGIYIAFRILDTADLTADGSFVFGMAVSAVVAITGHPFTAILAGAVAGAAAGFVTGILQTKLHIHPILSGILTMTALYTVNYATLGGTANLALRMSNGESAPTLYSGFSDFLRGIFRGVPAMMPYINNISAMLLSLLFVIALTAGLSLFFKTPTGLAIRATGNNESMVRASSINADSMRIIGIMVVNACVALSGSMLAEQKGVADLGEGTGMLVVGLASVIIGEVIFGHRGVTRGLIASGVGSIVYRLIIQVAYKLNMPNYTVKALSALIVAVALIIPAVRKTVSRKMRRSPLQLRKGETK